jgi:dTDP-4-dehydrorhamnose reductase
MGNALIGYTGFVGTTLLRQTDFEYKYRSTNINGIEGKAFDLVVCAGAPAQKWIANKDPEADRRKIESLIAHLTKVQAGTFVLISTVDVFKDPNGVNENTAIEEEGLHAYGQNRYLLEKFVPKQFSNYVIVRLPGLVGPGLRKNVIFDFLNNNNLEMIDSRSVFQFYPMVNLWYDIEIALNSNLKLIHLTAEPVSVADVSRKGFGFAFEHGLNSDPVRYDMRTCHASIYGSSGDYQYNAKETIQAVRSYAQSEPVTIKRDNART